MTSPRVHHLDCATLCPVARRLVNGNGSLFERARMTCHCLLVETDEGLILVDTGIGLEDVADPNGRLGRWFSLVASPLLRPEQTARRQVEALGFGAEDVRHIVMTHLDLDHAGGLPDFPDAEVHVHADELDAALARRGKDEARYRPCHWAHGPRWATHRPGGDTWKGFASVQAVGGESTEVLLVPAVGHTGGHSAVAVRQGDDWLLHAGDAYFHHGQMDPSSPSIPIGLGLFQRAVDTDRAARKRNQERLRQLAKADGDSITIFCAHDAYEWEQLAGAAAVTHAAAA